jgi:hypothetical protein
MEKYSIKCGKYMMKNSVYSMVEPKDDKVVKRFITLFEQVDKKNIVIESTYGILNEFLNKDDYPTVYQLMHKLFINNCLDTYLTKFTSDTISQIKNILKTNNFKQFCEWYIHNHRWINTFNHDINNNNKDIQYLINKIFPQSGPRVHINKMIFDNPFVSLDVQRLVEINKLEYACHTSGKITVWIYNTIDNKEKINVKRLFKIIISMFELANRKPKIHINIFNSNLKKYLGNNGSTVCPIHVNSGSTLKDEFINLWRSEELEKVLIHELIHFLTLDFNFFNRGYNTTEKYVANRFNVDGEIFINEAFTEAVGVLIHTAWVAHELGGNMDLCWKLLNLEINFSLFQCSKILKHFGFTNINQLLEKNGDNKIKQQSDIFSYFFVKTALLYNIENFLSFLETNISFNNRFKDFIKLVSSSLEQETFINDVNDYINIIKTDKTFIMATMRMTCIQLSST